LRLVFFRYINLRSGWEWQVPRHPDPYRPHSIQANFTTALDWLHCGKIRTQGLAALYPPTAAQEVYSGLADQSLPAMAAIFDWRAISE
jgi:hypothetical protein